jgi:O-antigen/teichoic acid export membrane protein
VPAEVSETVPARASRTEPAADAPRVELRSLARGGTLNLVGFVLSGVLGFALTLVVARGLGEGGAGVFFSAVAVYTILTNISELGADTGIVRFISRFRELGYIHDIRRTVTAALLPVIVAGLAAGAFMYMAAPWLAEVFVGDRQAVATQFLRLIAIYLPLTTVGTVMLAATRGFDTMVPFVSIESIGKPLLKPLLIVGFAALGGLTTREVAFGWGIPEGLGFVAAVVAIVLLLRRAERTADPTERPRTVTDLAGEFWRFSAPRGVAAAFQVSVLWFDVLLLGLYRPSADVGVYATVSRIVTVGTFALQAIRLAIAPQISKLLAREDRRGAQDVYQTATWWLMGVSWPLFLTLGVFAPLVLSVFGPGFVRGQDALVILSMAMLVNIGTGNVTVVLLMGGKSSWNLANTAVSLSLNVGLNLLLIPRFGMVGAAIAWSVSIIVDNVMALSEVRYFLGMRPFGPGYLVIAGLAAGCFGGIGLVVRSLLGDDWLAFGVFVLVAVPVYLASLFRFRNVLRLDTLLGGLRPRTEAV